MGTKELLSQARNLLARKLDKQQFIEAIEIKQLIVDIRRGQEAAEKVGKMLDGSPESPNK